MDCGLGCPRSRRSDPLPTVVLLGTLDTKGEEYAFVRELLEQRGLHVLLVDGGVHGAPAGLAPDISHREVAAVAGADVAALAAAGDRGAAVATMAMGAARIATQLREQGRLDAIMGLGGSGGSTMVAAAMRALPIGVPKLLVSTVAAGDTRPYVDTADIMLLPSVVDIAGINPISERILRNAVGAIAGMALAPPLTEADEGRADTPLIGATMFGVTTPCVTYLRQVLTGFGYNIVVFHATGAGGRAMERLLADGYLSGVVDVTTTELADELVGGVLSAGPDRLEAAGALGLPQVVSLGALDMVNFGPRATVPERFADRQFAIHNPTVTLMRTTPQENAELGAIMARKLNAAAGPLAVFIPLRGVSAIDVAGQIFHDPVADAALIAALRANLAPHIEVHELDTDINQPEFAQAMAERFDALYRAWAAQKGEDA